MKLRPNIGLLSRIFTFMAFVVFVLWLGSIVEDSQVVRSLVLDFGYLGVFIVAVASGFNLIIPVPAIVFLPIFSAAGLNPVTLVVIIALGMSVGDSIGYLLGYWGRKVFSPNSLPVWARRLKVQLEEYPFGTQLFLFFYSAFIPLPNEIVVIPASVSGIRWWYVLLPVTVGNVVFNTLSALGISSIFSLFV